MGRIIFGFLAAALAVLLVHQPIIFVLKMIGMLPPTATPYNMAAFAGAPAIVAATFAKFGFAGFPSLFNSVFWGGLWGILYGCIVERIPGHVVLKGLLFGLLVVILGNWLLVPLIKGGPLFANFDPMGMARGTIIQVGFGIGTAFLYSLMRRT